MTKKSEVKVSSRRKLLKSLTLGGATVAALPSEWTAPAMKAVILPAHSQTTDDSGDSGTGPTVGRTGPGDDPGNGFFGGFSSSGASYSMSVTAHADIACGNSASVTVRAPNGGVIAVCSKGGLGGSDLMSFSCSSNGKDTQNLDDSSLITFSILWENGCTCTWTHLAGDENGQVFTKDSGCS